MSHKKSWSRVKAHDKYRSENDRIFKRKRKPAECNPDTCDPMLTSARCKQCMEYR